MNLKLSRRDRGLTMCALIVLGLLLAAIAGLFMFIIVKSCDVCEQHRKNQATNDQDQIVVALKNPFAKDASPQPTFIAPSDWIVIEASTNVSSGYLPLWYINITTNSGERVVTTYNTNGATLSVAKNPAGDTNVSLEVIDDGNTWPNRFYRVRGQ